MTYFLGIKSDITGAIDCYGTPDIVVLKQDSVDTLNIRCLNLNTLQKVLSLLKLKQPIIVGKETEIPAIVEKAKKLLENQGLKVFWD